MFCVRVDNAVDSRIMLGFTPKETFDSKKEACVGGKDFNGCGLHLFSGSLCYPVDKYHSIIHEEISSNAKEIIVILEISNNGAKKEIRFLCNGNESESSDVSEHLEGNFVFPAICFREKNQRIATIPIEQTKNRTPEIKNLIKEYQQQQHNNVEGGEVKQARNKLLKQNEEMMSDFFKQFEQQANVSDVVEVETKKENTKEKEVKQVVTKKAKKETKPKTTKATKKKEIPKNNEEKKTKVKK
jgi:hypothetical protein